MRYLGERLVEPEATEFGYKALEFDDSMAGDLVVLAEYVADIG